MNNPIDYDNNSQELLRQFIKQLNEDGMDKDPTIASQDLKYIRGLQRARLARHGVKLQKTYGQAKKDIEGNAWKLDTDTSYVTRIPFKRLKATTEYISDRAKKIVSKTKTMYGYAVWLKGQKKPQKAYTCPNCGAASTIHQLNDGCSFCGTRFLMRDLYPKITGYYTLETPDRVITPFPMMILGAIAGVGISVYNNIIGSAGKPLTEIVFSVLTSAAMGVIGGVLLFIAAVLGIALVRVLRNLSKIKNYSRTKKDLPPFMRKYEPDFSMDYFIGKLVSLTSTLIYSDKADNLSIYEGESPAASLPDVVDAEWLGYLAMNKSYEQDGLLYLDMDIHMNCMHFENGKFSSKDHVFNLLLSKRAEAKTDYDFNVQAVNCNSCGASFDALREKHCPNCNTPFRMTDYDWTVKRFVSL